MILIDFFLVCEIRGPKRIPIKPRPPAGSKSKSSFAIRAHSRSFVAKIFPPPCPRWPKSFLLLILYDNLDSLTRPDYLLAVPTYKNSD